MTEIDSGYANGVWCMLGEPLTVAQIAQSGFDWICLDAQHGAFDDAAVVATMQTLAVLPERPVVAVRVSELSAAAIGRSLDAGADIVIVPMIESVEQAEAAVKAAHYPPLGQRSWGPLGGLWGAQTPDASSASTEVWVMLETRAGVAAAEDILAVDGVAGVFVGPFDLSLALDTQLPTLLAGADPRDPLPEIVRAARHADVRVGAFAGETGRAQRLRELGFEAIAVATDATLLAHGAAVVLGTKARGRTGY